MAIRVWRTLITRLISTLLLAPLAGAQVAAAPPTNQQVSGAFWRVDHTFQSTLRIKNDLAISSLLVHPALFMADGTEYDLPDIQLPQSGEVNVNINDALHAAPAAIQPHLSLFGTATIRFVHSWKPVEVSIENLDLPRSLIFNYQMTNTPGTKSGEHSFQGLWWKSTQTTRAFVALSNLGSADLVPGYEIEGKSGQPLGSGYVKLSPHETEVVDIQKLVLHSGVDENSVGSIHIEYQGQDGILAIAGGLEDDNVGFSAVLPFTSTDAPKDAKPADITIASVGLMLGKPDPMAGFPEKLRFSLYANLHNNSDKPLAVTIAGNYMNGQSPVNLALGEQRLHPHESVQLEMNQMLAAAGLGQFDGMLNLTYAYKGLENDLVIANGSIDQTGNYVFSVLPVPVGTSAGRAVNYWSVENGFDTMINLWNLAGQPENLLLTLDYADGSGSYRLPVSLPANASSMVGIMDLIMMRMPDANGNTIPEGVTHGSLEVTDAMDPTQVVNFVMSAAVFNSHTGTCSPNCQSCAGFTSAGIDPGSIDMWVPNSQQINSSVTWYNGSHIDKTANTSWTTTNSAIASFSTSTAGLSWGNSGGNSPLGFSFTSNPYINQICNSSCPTSTISGPVNGGPNDPTPNITSVTSLYAGTSNTLTITGSGFGTNQPSVSITDPSGAVYQSYYVTSYSDTQISVHVDVAGTSPPENASVTVTSTGYAGYPFQTSQGNSSQSNTASSPVNTANVTITAPLGIVNGNSAGFAVSNPNNLTVALFINSSGNGRATFSGGATSTQITQGSTVMISGTTVSSTANDLTIKATDPYGNQYTSKNFTVIWITISTINTQGQINLVSPDDDSAAEFFRRNNTYYLDGLSVAFNGAEIKGTVSPPNFTDNIILVQTLVSGACYEDGSNGSKASDCGYGYGSSYTCPSTDYTTCRIDDPGGGTNQDTTPAPNGNIYSFDTPGAFPRSSAGVSRFRGNFAIFAQYPSIGGSTASNVFTWYSVASALTRSDGSTTRETTYNSIGDNQAASGSTKTTWNLQ